MNATHEQLAVPETKRSAQAARRIAAAVGRERMRALHDERPVLDVLGFTVPLALVAGLAVTLATLPFGLVWCAAFVAQGFALQLLGFVQHDLFTHRKVWGERGSRLGSMICLTPLTVPATSVRATHLDHHKHTGTPGDSEQYKHDLDRRWVKLLFLVLPGLLLVASRAFKHGDDPAPSYMGAERHTDPVLRARIVTEQRVVIAWLAAVLVGAFVATDLVVFGYLLPLLFAFPFAMTLRTILEHADADLEDPIRGVTFYRTGWITRPLFFWSSGDCHLVHHLFPNIPFYRVGEAVELMRPHLVAEGAVERRSLVALMWGWFITNRPHGVPWPAPAQG